MLFMFYVKFILLLSLSNCYYVVLPRYIRFVLGNLNCCFLLGDLCPRISLTSTVVAVVILTYRSNHL
jgi:hypothetical protein